MALIREAESRFIELLNQLNEPVNRNLQKYQGFMYLRPALTSVHTMKKYFDSKMSDIRYVIDSIEGNEIYDAGCGSGSFSILLSYLGAKKVIAVDFLDDAIVMTKKLVELAGIKNVEVVKGDIAEILKQKRRVDGIFSIEAISHYRNYKAFLRGAAECLGPGCFLVIRDGNNAASKSIRSKTYEIWDHFERNTFQCTIHGHQKGDGCYLKMREAIIKESFPSLTIEQIRNYAEWTFAYSRDNVIKAVTLFLKNDVSMRSEYAFAKCPLDPSTDLYMEYLINPYELKKELIELGFESSVKSLGPVRRQFFLIRYWWELLSAITIYTPRPFLLIARKQCPN
jgi:2-polyprenyl-3-methyl-5-hydroxy-6-metoxy-1,4-benzoquinol methylase